MARIKISTVVDPVEYPKLSPWDYLNKGLAAGIYATQQELILLSGFPKQTWDTWLYRGKQCPPEKQERLHRIASDLGWA